MSARPPVFKSFVGFTVCGAAFLLGSAMVRHAVPRPVVPTIDQKLEHLRRNPERYNCLLVGTSRVYHHFDPQRFDARTAAGGVETRTLNFGVQSLKFGETEVVLSRLADSGALKFDWVLVEVRLDNHAQPLNWRTSRHIHWHEPLPTWYALASCWDSWPSREINWQEAYEHCFAFVVWLTNQGRIPTWIGSRLRPVSFDVQIAKRLGPAGDGFIPMRDIPNVEQRRERFLDKLEGYRERVEMLRQQENAELPPLGAPEIATLRRMLSSIHRLGARPMFIVTSGLRAVPSFGLSADEYPYPVLRYNRPSRYPELYDVELRIDSHHLDFEGAQIATDLLADDFLRLVQPEKGG